MKRTPILALLLSAATVWGGDITEGIKSGSFWTADKKTLSSDALKGVRYAPVDELTIRIPRDGGLTIGNLSFGETVLSWTEEETPGNMVMMVYNKGDDGSLDRDEYMAVLKETITALNELIGVKGKTKKVNKRDSAVALKCWQWEWDGGIILLEASYTGGKKDFESEFLRLKLGANQEAIAKGGARDVAKRRELKDNVKIDEESRDVWIEGVPMVDQGEKGYCVPATVARVFAYYGMDGVDQHALAQLCDSSADGGTSTSTMQSALENISRKFHIRVQSMDGKTAEEAIMNFIADYNKAAKKLRKPQASPMDWVMVATDEEVLLTARANKRYLKKWIASIKKSIDMGIPVLWSVQLGIFPEQGIPQSFGGHMRLIIGYNEKNETLIYSDSWGEEHAKKEMPLKHAAAMTHNRFILRPSR